MNEVERIIEVTGYSEPVRITWHKDPTRHLLKQKAVNAKSKTVDTRLPDAVEPSNAEGENRVSED